MTIFLSPSKDMDFDTPVEISHESSKALFLSQSDELIRILKKFSIKEVQRLMAISSNLAELNVQRYKSWSKDIDLAPVKKPAIFAFDGDVYTEFKAKTLGQEQLAPVQQRMVILSGLYGALRPFDLIQPYRLEMGRRIFSNSGSKKGPQSLPVFWEVHIKKYLSSLPSEFFVNLASQEYSEAIPRARSNFELWDHRPLYQIHFLDAHKGTFAVKGFFAKKARGAFARALCELPNPDPGQLKEVEVLNYKYNSNLSNDRDLVFTRT